MPRNDCPLCAGNTEAAGLGPAAFDLRRCIVCHVVYLPAQDMTGHALESQEQFFRNMDHGPWQRFLDVMNARLVLRRLRKYKSSGRLLEVGIGNGNFLRTAQASGYDCMGVEASESLAWSFSLQNSIPVFPGYLDDFARKMSSERFDVLVMNHVLEHIPDPLAALRQLCGLLQDGGIIHIAVPNVDAWEARLKGWSAFEPYHLYYFNPGTLSNLVRQAGLNIRRIRTAERFSGWTNALARTLLQREYQQMRLSGARTAPSFQQQLALAGLDVARVAMGAVTLQLRYVQSQVNRGEELIAILEHP